MLQPFFNGREELTIWNDACVARGERAVIPLDLRQRVLSMAHEGHFGVVKTKQRCRSSVWWPKLDHQIEEFIKDCEACVLSEKSGHPRPGPLQAILWPREPWSKLQVDIVGELYSAPVTHKYIIVVHDLHSKWLEVKACSHVDSKEVIVFLCDLFVRWGLPRVLITDINSGLMTLQHFFQVREYSTHAQLFIILKAMAEWSGLTKS